MSGSTTEAIEETNEVALTGRLSGEASIRELPSGDELVTWRVVVARGEG